MRIVPRNALANQYNEEKLEAFQVERARMLQEMRISGKPVYTIYAVDTHLDPTMDEIVDPICAKRFKQMWGNSNKVMNCAGSQNNAAAQHKFS